MKKKRIFSAVLVTVLTICVFAFAFMSAAMRCVSYPL